jgi:hypothetical protein
MAMEEWIEEDHDGRKKRRGRVEVTAPADGKRKDG